MPSGATYQAARRALAALLVSVPLHAQAAAKCDLPLQSHPKMLTAGMQFNAAFKEKSTPADKVKALQATVKSLTDDVTGFPAAVQPSRNFLLSQALLVWMEQPGTGMSENRGKLGYTADAAGTIDIPAALDTAFRAISAAKPECSDSLRLYGKSVWGQLINKAVTFSNAQQQDSAEYYARRSMLFDDKQYYAYNIMANVALTKNDTSGMIEWFTKTADVTAASTDTNAIKVRDNMVLNLASLYNNAAVDATGPKKAELSAKAADAYKRYLGYYPNDLTTKMRLMRLSGSTLDSAGATKFVDEILAGSSTVSDVQLTTVGSEFTSPANKFYAAGLRLFDAALKKNPNSRDALYNSAVTLNNLERFEEMRPFVVKIRQIDPNNTSVFNLARNIQTAGKLAVQTRANKGVRPKPGTQVMLTPVQQAQLKVFNDSLVYYTTLMQNTTPAVDIKNFSPAADGASLTVEMEVPAGKPASAYGITVEFLDAASAVVATQTAQSKSIAAGTSDTVTVTGKGSGIVAFRYRVAK